MLLVTIISFLATFAILVGLVSAIQFPSTAMIIVGVVAAIIGILLSLLLAGVGYLIFGNKNIPFSGFFGTIGRGFQVCIITTIYEIIQIIVTMAILLLPLSLKSSSLRLLSTSPVRVNSVQDSISRKSVQ